MYTKLHLLHFYYLIIKNPLKILYLLSAITTYYYAGTFSPVKNEVEVINYFVSNNNHLYVFKEVANNQIIYKVFNSNKEEKVSNGMLTYYNYNSANIMLWVLFGASLILFLGSPLIDDEVGWEVDKCFGMSLKWFVKCDKVEDRYYYYAFNRLITEDKYKHTYFNHIGSISNLKILPFYHSKTEVRDKILDRIINS